MQNTEITTQWIIDLINWCQIQKADLNLQLLQKKQELEKSTLFNDIKDLEYSLKQIELQEDQRREKGKEIMISSWIKSFTLLSWQTIQLNKTPWSLVIENEDLIPTDYKTDKIVTTIDKKKIKDDIKIWCLVDGCYISEDYSLVIKN
jgi:hypothetical protein